MERSFGGTGGAPWVGHGYHDEYHGYGQGVVKHVEPGTGVVAICSLESDWTDTPQSPGSCDGDDMSIPDGRPLGTAWGPGWCSGGGECLGRFKIYPVSS